MTFDVALGAQGFVGRDERRGGGLKRKKKKTQILTLPFEYHCIEQSFEASKYLGQP